MGHVGFSCSCVRVSCHAGVSVGVVAPVIVNHLITPWYLTYWALGRIAHSYDTAVTLLRAQYDQMVVQHSRVDHPPHPHLAAAAAATQQDGRDTRPDDTASHATHGSSQSHAAEPALARERTCPLRASPSKPPGTVTAVGVTDTQPNSTGSVAITIGASEGVQSDKKTGPSLADVQGPLTEVLGTLARDATLWQRGLLATPHAVHALMAAMTLMADRLAAVQVCVCVCVRVCVRESTYQHACVWHHTACDYRHGCSPNAAWKGFTVLCVCVCPSRLCCKALVRSAQCSVPGLPHT